MNANTHFVWVLHPTNKAAYQKTSNRVYVHFEQAKRPFGQSRHVDPEMAMDGCRNPAVYPIILSLLL